MLLQWCDRQVNRFFKDIIMSALRKVLVVDDDPVVGESFNRVLSGKGYAVITASDGQEALAKLEAEQYDVVFTDLRMPGMTGLEVAESVRARQPWIPVVIVTGYGSSRSEERARAAGVSDFLHKPLSPDMIEDSAARALRHAASPAIGQPQPAAAVAPALAEPAVAKRPKLLKNMALFLLAPFVGLVYAVLLPFVGLGMLAWIGGKSLLERPGEKTIATPPRAE
jgi:CheY-like chemotaxis protein